MSASDPEVLVSPQWLKERLHDTSLRIIEVDVDPKVYQAGHIPGAIGLDWAKDLQDPVQRDIPSRQQFETLLSTRGVSPEHTVILYGDSANWFAAYAFWVFKLYGHKDVRLLDGGRAKWLADDTLPMGTQVPTHPQTVYRAQPLDERLRARVADALDASRNAASRRSQLVDVRSPDEFSGKVIAPPGMNETAQRAGHIPGAVSVPWATATNPDGTFKSREELARIYIEGKGMDSSTPTLAYCRIGERSSHTWFVLKYLLGFKDVKNYDGSWTEYGSMIGVPIERNV